MNLRPAWRLPLLALSAAWALLLLLYFGTASSIVEIWNRSETFAHAYVVPPIAAWLVWRRRADLADLVPAASWRWLLALLPAGLLWLLGELVASNAATQFGFAFMLVLLVPGLLGSQVAHRILFPLGFLFFAIPFGDFMTPWLMDRTADFTVAAVRLSGIPVYREGLHFIIPSGAWSVVEACSGIRYLIASVMVGTLFAYLNYQSMGKRWLFLGVSIVTPLIANWLRAYMIVMLGHLSDNKLATGVDHLVYGWVFFGIVMLVMFMIGARWTDPDVTHAAPAGGHRPQVSSQVFWGGVALSLLMVAVPRAWQAQLGLREGSAQLQLTAPKLPGWEWQAEPLADWVPSFERPTQVLHGRWVREGVAPIGVYVAYYRQQDFDSKLISSVNGLVNPEVESRWSIARAQLSSVPLEGGQLPMLMTELRSQEASLAPRLVAFHTFWVVGESTTSGLMAKLSAARSRLLGQGDDSAVVIFYASKDTLGAENAPLREFATANWRTVDAWLNSVRKQASSH
jgi:exosortase A